MIWDIAIDWMSKPVRATLKSRTMFEKRSYTFT